MWVRGLKLDLEEFAHIYSSSHPVWVRGLKQNLIHYPIHPPLVAPRVGAWIETKITTIALLFNVSHPVWVRGLKLK